jgi:hypothetical protein
MLHSLFAGPFKTAVLIGAVLMLVVGIGQAATAMYVGGRAIGGGVGVTVYDFIPGMADGFNQAKADAVKIRQQYQAQS